MMFLLSSPFHLHMESNSKACRIGCGDCGDHLQGLFGQWNFRFDIERTNGILWRFSNVRIC